MDVDITTSIEIQACAPRIRLPSSQKYRGGSRHCRGGGIGGANDTCPPTGKSPTFSDRQVGQDTIQYDKQKGHGAQPRASGHMIPLLLLVRLNVTRRSPSRLPGECPHLRAYGQRFRTCNHADNPRKAMFTQRIVVDVV